MMNRRHMLALGTLSAASALLPGHAQAQSARDTLILGMTLEPPVLDPTVSAASAVAEVTLYNVYETLTRINSDGRVTPLLAESWEVAPDLRTYTMRLRRDVRFHNGEPLTAETVKFAFERAGSEKSTNKDRRIFADLQVQAVDTHTVVITTQSSNPDFLFVLGQATAVIVEPKSAATNATAPVGTGPYVLQKWQKGASLTLAAWPQYREAGRIRIRQAVFRFIPDAAAQVAAVLAGDVDVFPRVTPRGAAHLKGDARYQVIVSGSRAKTIVAFNHRHKALADVRVRRAIAAAIDRKAMIEAAADGYGVPIGSHYVPGAFGFIDTTGINPYDPEKAARLLAEAGVKLPLKLRMTLPPTPYARQGGELVAAQLAAIGVQVQLQSVEWAQWLSGTYGKKQYDLTLISHVEPLDLDNFTRSDYYWGYDSQAFRDLYHHIQHTANPTDRARLLGDAQRLLAQDAAHVFLYQPQWVTVASRHLRGLWKDMPVSVNDLSSLYWV